MCSVYFDDFEIFFDPRAICKSKSIQQDGKD